MLRALILALTLLLAAASCFADQTISESVDSTTTNSQWLSGLGFQTGSYKYEEPGLMETRGQLYRINGYLAYQANSFHVTTELTVGVGNTDYFGSYMDGTPLIMDGIENKLYEFRLLVGPTFKSGSMQFIPAIGYGIRSLDYLPKEQPPGYDRHSKYRYVPFRMQVIQPLSKRPFGPQLSAIIEYDHFLGGTQTSDLSVASGTYFDDSVGLIDVIYPDATNDQNSGSGTRFSLAWDLGTQPGKFGFQVSVYYESWRIDESVIAVYEIPVHIHDPAEDEIWYMTTWEPENRTREIGITLRLTRF